jgi:hypothetical protein
MQTRGKDDVEETGPWRGLPFLLLPEKVLDIVMTPSEDWWTPPGSSCRVFIILSVGCHPRLLLGRPSGAALKPFPGHRES